MVIPAGASPDCWDSQAEPPDFGSLRNLRFLGSSRSRQLAVLIVAAGLAQTFPLTRIPYAAPASPSSRRQAAGSPGAPAPAGADVPKLLRARCQSCHGATERGGGL